MYDAARIRKQTNIEQVEIHEQLASTNDRALELLRRHQISTPALIVTEIQTAGRGQRDRTWWSGTGSLTFSWVAPMIDPTRQGPSATRLLPIASALAVANAIETLADLGGIEVKWPNDLIVSGRKLCGILIESVSVDSLTAIVVGIGINVNNEDLTPEQIHRPKDRKSQSADPTSLFLETGRPTPLEELLIGVVRQLDEEFQLTNADPMSIVRRCNARLAFKGRTIHVDSPSGNHLQGICEGIGNEGGLILRSAEGAVTIYTGTISVV